MSNEHNPTGGPPPPIRKARPSKYPFATLAVGEFFFIPHKRENTFASYASLWGQKTGRQFATRLTHMRRAKTPAGWEKCEPHDRGAVMGVGCWRIEDKLPEQQGEQAA